MSVRAILEINEAALEGTATEAWLQNLRSGAVDRLVYGNDWVDRTGSTFDSISRPFSLEPPVMGEGWTALRCWSVAEAEWLAEHMRTRRGVPAELLHLRVIPSPHHREDSWWHDPNQQALPMDGSGAA